MEGIECADLGGGALADILLRGTIEAAVEPIAQDADLCSDQLRDALSLLPAELRRVLRLPSPARQCFTMRFLAGLPGQDCACLLNFEACQVEEAAILGACLLTLGGSIASLRDNQAKNNDDTERHMDSGRRLH